MKKGFTLIELLAVIVILAVIAIIATPIILNIIEDTREQAAKSSANLYVDGLVKQIASKNMINEFNPTSCTVTNGNVTCDGTALDYTINGEKPTSGTITLNNGVITAYNLCMSDYRVRKTGDTITTTKDSSCSSANLVPLYAAGATDTYKAIVYLDPTDLSKQCSIVDAMLNTNENGTPTGIISGCMKFYIYDDSGSTYKMILDHNTTNDIAAVTKSDFIAAGGTEAEYDDYDFSNINTTLIPITMNAKISSDTQGWVGSPRLITADEVAHIVGADTAISWNSSKSFKWEDELSDSSTQVSWIYFDGTGTTYGTWQNASNDYIPIANQSNKSRYAWLYDYTYSCIGTGCNIEENSQPVHGYWTSTDAMGEEPGGRYVIGDGGIYADGVFNAFAGIRPVIELPKKSFTNNTITLPTIQKYASSNPSSDTHKGIVFLDPTDLSRECTAALATANVNSNGTPTGITSGCMKFYIYDDSDSLYKLILDHNTSGDVFWNLTLGTEPLEVAERLALDTAGWTGNPRLITADEIAHIVGADTALGFDQTDSNTDWFTLDGSGATYANWQITSVSSSNRSRYAWLYNNTYNCISCGCNVEDNNSYPYLSKTSETLQPIYGYWTSVQYAKYTYRAWGINNSGQARTVYKDYDRGGSLSGVRPVIELPSLLFSSNYGTYNDPVTPAPIIEK